MKTDKPEYGGLTITIHGESGVGKSRLANTAPGPKLFLDAEGGTEWLDGESVYWEPLREDPPAAGTWNNCIVLVRDFETMDRVYQWLNSGMHCFKSVILDSLTEIQMRALDTVMGGSIQSPTQQNWGTLLRHMDQTVRRFRDLKMHPTNPVKCIVFVCLAGEHGGDTTVTRPYLSGQIRLKLPGYTDVVAYMFNFPNQDNPNDLSRAIYVQPFNGFVAKDRTGKLPGCILSPNLQAMIDLIHTQPVVENREVLV